jgi:YVTN family beta-propeller protein
MIYNHGVSRKELNEVFRMNFGQARMRLVQAGAVLAAAVLVAGCGNNYRPVVTPTNGSGPAAEPESLVVAVSARLPIDGIAQDGIATIVDYSGDSITAYADLGVNPIAFTVDEAGANGYTLNSDGTLTSFPFVATGSSNLTSLVKFTTLLDTAKPLNLFSPSSGLWVADLCGTYISSQCGSGADVFSGSPEKEQSSVSVAATPVMVVGPSTVGLYDYAISQNISNPTGVECNNSPTTQPLGAVTEIAVSSDMSAAPIPVGKCPVYGVISSDSNANGSQRLFVLNRGSDTITVINTLTGALDTNCAATNQDGQTINCPVDGTLQLPTGSGPVYAEYNAVTSQLVVANYDGGTISIIDVALDKYGNDSAAFGTTYTVPVGSHPASVTALAYNGSYAYAANQSDETVSVVNLSSHTVEATLPVTGHPRTIVSTQSSEEYGKVYVASPDSPDLTIINAGGTGMNTVDTPFNLSAGNLVDVRVSAQNGVSGNSNNVSRMPGYGQPCNLPGTAPTASITACRAMQ